MNFKVSVIIPVYNADQFVRKAVESAINLIEVEEVLLIEDGSQDYSLAVCKELVMDFEKVKLFTHPQNINKGAGASRNLGIQNASSDYIAFLDADDYYLPNRFKVDEQTFNTDPTIEAVYGCTKAEFENEIAKEKFLKKFNSVFTTLNREIPSPELFDALLFSSYGYFSTDAITLKKTVFSKVGFFDEELKLAEDTLMWLKLACICHLAAGSIDSPIAVRYVHADNSIHASFERTNEYKVLMYEKLFIWSVKQNKLSFSRRNRIFSALHMAKNRKPTPLKLLLNLVWKYPNLLSIKFFYKKCLMSLKIKE